MCVVLNCTCGSFEVRDFVDLLKSKKPLLYLCMTLKFTTLMRAQNSVLPCYSMTQWPYNDMWPTFQEKKKEKICKAYPTRGTLVYSLHISFIDHILVGSYDILLGS